METQDQTNDKPKNIVLEVQNIKHTLNASIKSRQKKKENEKNG